MKCGIVGLPNVGKSTLFNCLSNAKALAANYPFATIEPNVGRVAVPDQRLEILGKIGKSKKSDQILVGFALEDRDEIVNARKKLISKNLDMIVLNSLNNKETCFLHDTNSVKMILQDSVISTGLDTKYNIAVYILDFLHQEFYNLFFLKQDTLGTRSSVHTDTNTSSG